MYLFKRGLLPNCFRNMFTLTSQLQSHYTKATLEIGLGSRNYFQKIEAPFMKIKASLTK